MSTQEEGAVEVEAAPLGNPTTSVTTPSGLEIEYYAKPRRFYRVRKMAGNHPTEGWIFDPEDPESRWREVPSVTTVLKVLDKPALPWWGMKVGVDATRTLIATEKIRVGYDGTTHGFYSDGTKLLEVDDLILMLIENKLTVNHVKEEAGDRGTGVHDALEAWAAIGKMPNPNDFPWDEKGYVTGLRAFLDDAAFGGLKPEMMEVSVASVEHGYAGRFDLLARNSSDMKVITKVYDKWKPKATTVPAGSRGLIDLKTSKGIYESHFLQLEAYEGAMQECGYGATDYRAVLHVMADGRYEFRRARATLDQWLAVLACAKAIGEVKEAMKL